MKNIHHRQGSAIGKSIRKRTNIITFAVFFVFLVPGLCSAAGFTADQWNDKGVDLYHNESYEEALDAYEKAIELDPEHELAWYNKGLVLFSLEQYNDAVIAYKHALNINPSSVDSWYNLGLTLGKTGNLSESEEAFARSLQLEEEQSKKSGLEEPGNNGPSDKETDNEDSADTDDAEFDRLYQKSERKITDNLHQIVTWLNDGRWGEVDKQALKTSKFIVDYLNELKALQLSDSYEDKRDSYVFFLEQVAGATSEISEVASLYPVYFNHGNVNYYNKGDEEDYLKRLESAITALGSAQDELDRFNEKYFS